MVSKSDLTKGFYTQFVSKMEIITLPHPSELTIIRVPPFTQSDTTPTIGIDDEIPPKRDHYYKGDVWSAINFQMCAFYQHIVKEMPFIRKRLRKGLYNVAVDVAQGVRIVIWFWKLDYSEKSISEGTFSISYDELTAPGWLRKMFKGVNHKQFTSFGQIRSFLSSIYASFLMNI